MIITSDLRRPPAMTSARPQARGPRRKLIRRFKRKLARSLIADAPPDYDEAMAPIRPLPRWVRLLLLFSLVALTWAAVIAGVALLLR